MAALQQSLDFSKACGRKLPCPSIQERFEAFHAANPHVYERFKHYAYRARAAGLRRYSADGIGHLIRWDFSVVTESADFKLNNSFTSRYARKLMDEDSSFEGFFETRALTEAGGG